MMPITCTCYRRRGRRHRRRVSAACLRRRRRRRSGRSVYAFCICRCRFPVSTAAADQLGLRAKLAMLSLNIHKHLFHKIKTSGLSFDAWKQNMNFIQC